MSERDTAAPAAWDSAKVLLERGNELVESEAADRIWENAAFHTAAGLLRAGGANIPDGPSGRAYLSLVLAAYESHRAAEKMAEATQ